MNWRIEANDVLSRVDGLSPWIFTGCLYLVRWIVVVPIGYAVCQLGGSNNAATFTGSPMSLLLGFIFLAPLSETLIECAVPYWLMSKAGRNRLGERPWAFVVVSALLMALLHVGAWPSAILPSLVTGSFLAYTYGHFATSGTGWAILHTCVFHAGINMVGWLLLVAF